MKHAIALPIIAVLVALTACHSHGPELVPPVRPVLTRIAAPQSLRATDFAGTVEARYASALAFRVLGRIVSREVDLGDRVKHGDLIAALDPVPFRLAVEQAKAELLKKEAHRHQTMLNAARKRQLFAEGAVAQAVFETAQHEWDSAEAAAGAARANVSLAEEQLSYTELRATFDGVITETAAEVGQVVQPGQKVVSLVRPEEVEAVVDVPDHLTKSLQMGADFLVTAEGNTTAPVRGKIREIAPQADAHTRTQRIRITLLDPPPSLRIGSVIKAVAQMDADQEVELPLSALLESEGKTFVWVVDAASSRVTTQEVIVSSRSSNSFRIAHGVEPGTRVVTAGVHSLTLNQLVNTQDNSL